MGKIVINVSGRLFVTTTETLAKYPDTRLGKIATEEGQGQEIYFDEDEEVFREVLRYYRTGELHLPHGMCRQTVYKQLAFWQLANIEPEQCCQNDKVDEKQLEKQFDWFERRIELNRELNMKDKLWYFLTDPTGPYTRYKKAAVAWAWFYILLVVIQSVSYSLVTLPAYAKNFMSEPNATHLAAANMFIKTPCKGILQQKHFFEIRIPIHLYLCSLFFVIEITVRLISCPKKKEFVCSINMMDLAVTVAEVIEYFVIFITEYAVDLENANENICLTANALQLMMYALVQLRCLRVFTIAMICSELRVLILAICASRKEILLLVTVIAMSCLLLGPTIYYLEMIGAMWTDDGIMGIDSVPIGYWWVVVTMTTVGYGDYYPKTAAGYVAATAVMMVGMMLTALPIAIIGANFSLYYDYNRKRNRLVKAKKKQESLLKAKKKQESLLKNNHSVVREGVEEFQLRTIEDDDNKRMDC